MKHVLDHFRLQAYILTFTLMIYTFWAPPLIHAKNVQYTRLLIKSFGFTSPPIPSQNLFHLGLVSDFRAMMVPLGKAKKNILASPINKTPIKPSTGKTNWFTDSSFLGVGISQGYGNNENTSFKTSVL